MSKWDQDEIVAEYQKLVNSVDTLEYAQAGRIVHLMLLMTDKTRDRMAAWHDAEIKRMLDTTTGVVPDDVN